MILFQSQSKVLNADLKKQAATSFGRVAACLMIMVLVRENIRIIVSTHVYVRKVFQESI